MFGVAISIVGPVAIAAAIGALVVLATDPPRAGRSWATALLPLSIGGAILTFVAVSIGGQAVPAALLVGVVGVVGALHGGRSRKAGVRGLVATLWIIVALTLSATGVGALAYAVAFGVGGAVGAMVALARARKGTVEGTGADDVEAEASAEPPILRALLTSPIGQFAILRGIGLAAAVFLGFTFFPGHPAWLAISSLLVMRPPTRNALVVGVQRSLGTGVGVIAAVALASVIGENTPALVILFLTSAFLMMAVREVNYALFAIFVTAVVVYSQRILGADAAESGIDRLAETVVGVAIAFVVLGLTEVLARRRSRSLMFTALRAMLRDPEGKIILVWVIAQILLGTVVYAWLEGWSPVDSLYFSVVTLATVGFVVLHPTTDAAKLFTVLYILVGLGVFAAFIAELTKHRASTVARLRAHDDPPEPDVGKGSGDAATPAPMETSRGRRRSRSGSVPHATRVHDRGGAVRRLNTIGAPAPNRVGPAPR